MLVDNMAGARSTLGEWGLSFFVEAGEHRILLDTGGGRVLLGNARALNIDLTRISAIALSHAHPDHTGGLDQAVQLSGPVDFYVHPGAFIDRYLKADKGAVKLNMPLSRAQLGSRVRKLVETRNPALIFDGVMVTGQIPRVTGFEDTGLAGHAFLDEGLATPDPILDDQALVFRVPEGVVILLGCGHSGVVNTVRYVRELVGEIPIYAVMGGTHLLSASSDRMQKTIEALRKYNVQKIMLSHCTGLDAYVELAKAFPGRCSWPISGRRIQFGREE